MLNISIDNDGTVHLEGRLDASQAEEARNVFKELVWSCDIDFTELEYISSAGLGVLLEAQQRLKSRGQELSLVGMKSQTRHVFELAGFDAIFQIS